MSIGRGLPGFRFTKEGIQLAPAASGTYALFTASQWVYFGESNDIRRRLEQHLLGDNVLLSLAGPTGFQFEMIPNEQQRIARQNQLIALFTPTCNQMYG